MDLPDCPPGAEGYEDSVVEVAKKPSIEDSCGTKAEKEFLEHLNSLKIKVENGGARPMVERRGRDVSGKWIYLCYPCAAVCSGESILQTHISGKKHKIKLSMKNVWPTSIFEEHPFVLSEKGTKKDTVGGATEKVLQKMAEEVNYHNNPSELETKYNKYRNVHTHIQDSLDTIKAPLLGVEYLVEHPSEEMHEPAYICTLCNKQGHPRTIINHLTCFWHRYNYLVRHFAKASRLLDPYKSHSKFREGVTIVINRLSQRIEDKYGRLKPVSIDKEEYDKEKDRIHQWLFKSYHFTEKDGPSFEEVVDTGLIESLNQSNQACQQNYLKDPSPPVVAAPTKPMFNPFSRHPGRQERRAGSFDRLSDISDEGNSRRHDIRPMRKFDAGPRGNMRYEPYRDKRRESPTTSRYASSKPADKQEKQKAPNHEYKLKLAEEKRQTAENAAKKALAYHEKNPEKHPLYPEEWKKFWNRRYKEIQAEGKDPSKHDFKPEWIVFWTARMKELHDEEVRVIVNEIYRKMCLTPPDMIRSDDNKSKSESGRKSPDSRRRSPESRRRTPPKRRSPEPRRRSPEPRRRSPEPRRRSPIPRRRSPDPRRRSPEPRRRSPDPRRRSPDFKRQIPPKRPNDRYGRDYRSSERRSMELRFPPHRTRSRSPVPRRRSRSPLSQREAAPLRNRSRSPSGVAPSLQTVLISDDELRPDDGTSPWNSDNDSLGSLPEVKSPVASRTGSEMSKSSKPRAYSRPAEPSDLGPPENVVATLRLLVALEDYLGSIGPKIVDLLTEALQMEKVKANSSEELLIRDSAVVLLETAKEKLKGAVQAGLVPTSAAAAVRSAVVRTAATLHEADNRTKANKEAKSQEKAAPVPVAGVGEVDRAQIAQQMAAALIAQGKTDVSSEELAQLVDAVVGMAEAKKREAEKRAAPATAAPTTASKAPITVKSSSASALQLLQSAYDENDKKPKRRRARRRPRRRRPGDETNKAEKEGTPDAMDGLSDSDLETLLKNFNELSAEEQHSLIAYLKKLEAREPQRVEKLRQYVSAAATSEEPPKPPVEEESKRVVAIIESDDDDYTVEEIFQSATQKVKEDQIRQEMEIVKKSLEESKAETVPTETQLPVNLPMNFSSASDLLALVQASIQSSGTTSTSDVVTSNTQPRSFGDVHESLPNLPQPSKPLLETPIPPKSDQLEQSGVAQRPIPNFPPFGNRDSELFSNQSNVNERPMQNIPPLMHDNRSPTQDNSSFFGQGNRGPFMTDNRGSQMHDNRGPLLQGDSRGPLIQDNMGSLMMDNRGPLIQDNRGPLIQDDRGFQMQDNRGPQMQDNRGPQMQDNRELQMQDNGGPQMHDNRGPHMQDNRGPQMQDNRAPFMQDNRGSQIQDNRGLQMQDNRGPLIQDNRGPLMQGNRPHMQDNRGPLLQDNRGFQMQDNRISPMQGNRGPYMQGDGSNYMQDNRNMSNNNRQFPMQNDSMANNTGNMQGSRPPLLQGGGNFMQDSRGPPPRGNFNNNHGPRNNFMNGRQDNYQQQDYGNQQKNFRGRGGGGGGRGQFGGSMRGRGRGFY